ncbi:hypothetical protein [Streptomyces spiramyceticus]|uniref:hypothetical protein n=1 Tax=Streptomyces spiramyceticus TaxID=299717 RepID=UPI00237A1E06|nr:hypothetical protein [Streptomyces spiramyceticus]
MVVRPKGGVSVALFVSKRPPSELTIVVAPDESASPHSTGLPKSADDPKSP